MEMLTLGHLALDAVPRLETPDLILRAPLPEDLPAAAAMNADPAFYQFLGNAPADEETVWRRMLSHLGHWALTGYGSWAVEEKATGAFIGNMGFFDVQRDLTPSIKGVPEAGWGLAPHLHGRGYASQALGAAAAWADLQLPAPRTVCIIDPANEASLRLAYRHGYREYGRTLYRDVEIVLLERPRGGRS